MIGLISVLVMLLLVSNSFRVITAQSPAGGDWTSFTLDNSDSRYQAASTITSSNVASLTQAWSYDTQYSVTGTPVVLDGNVYFGDWGGNVYSVSISNGDLNWEVNLGAPISSTLALANGYVYVALGPTETDVYALSQASGQTVWHTQLMTSMPSSWASPIIYNGLLYIGVASNGITENNASQKGEIDALNALTGALVWRFSTMIGTAGGSGEWGSVAIDPTLNSIYFGTGNTFSDTGSSLYAYSIISLDATTGTLNWFYQVYDSELKGHDNDFGSTPNLFTAVVKGVTYNAIGLGNKNGVYYILNRANGQLLTTVPVGTTEAGITGVAGFIYPSGNVNPELFIPSAQNPLINKQPGVDGVVEAYTPNSRTVDWRFLTPGDIDGSVAIVPGAVFFGDTLGNLYAVSTTSGTQLFRATLPYGIQSGVTVAEGYVLVGDYDPSASGPVSGLGLYAFSVS